ncbi:hypothetical protein [Bifidobacterium felsineum]|uniref:hypothetical protein n=1 Tax=Bifidobacterium felsineum TaxID=2045440 RepID=UPI001BDC7528|nr:hypothetical protein [Bifidobacterium felsineum]MBT1163057.1 hypothetical protein [Bifidobacterium felsineum]
MADDGSVRIVDQLGRNLHIGTVRADPSRALVSFAGVQRYAIESAIGERRDAAGQANG